MIERKPRQFLAAWNDDGTSVKGAAFEESLFVDGAFWKNELSPVAPESFDSFGSMFSNQLQIQYNALLENNAVLESQFSACETAKNNLQKELEDKTKEVDKLTLEMSSLSSQAETLTSEKSSLSAQVAALTTRSNELNDEKDKLGKLLNDANERIKKLLESIPFNPRIIDATAFYNRLTKDEILLLLSSENQQILLIGKTIAAYKSNDWPVVLESTEFQQMVGYLQQVGVLTEPRLAELTKDATREEAYSAE